MEDVKKKLLYEVGYHLVPTITEDNVGTEVARVRKEIEDRGGAVVSEEWPKQTELAYTVTHHKENTRTKYNASYFGWIQFEMDTNQILEFQGALKDIDTLLRFIAVMVPREKKQLKKKRRPRPILQRALSDTKKEEEPTTVVATDEIDKEIEKLVAE